MFSPEVLNLVNWHLGSAVYTFPTEFFVNGSWLCGICLLLCGVITCYSYHVLITAAKILNVEKSFSKLVDRSLGRFAAQLLCVLVIINCVGVFSAYSKLMEDMIFILPINSTIASILTYTLLVIVLILSIRSDHAIDVPYADIIANVALVLLSIGLCYAGFVTGRSSQFTIDNNITQFSIDFKQIIRFRDVLTVFIFSFSSAEILFTYQRATINLFQTGKTAVILSFLVYIIIGIAGSYAKHYSSNVDFKQDKISLLQFVAKDVVCGYIIVFANFISIALSLPVFLINLRRYFGDLRRLCGVGQGHNGYTRSDQLVMLILFILSLFISKRFPTLVELISAVSGSTDCLFMLVFPALIGLLYFERSLINKILCSVMLIIGVILVLLTVLTWSSFGQICAVLVVIVVAYQANLQRAQVI